LDNQKLSQLQVAFLLPNLKVRAFSDRHHKIKLRLGSVYSGQRLGQEVLGQEVLGLLLNK